MRLRRYRASTSGTPTDGQHEATGRGGRRIVIAGLRLRASSLPARQLSCDPCGHAVPTCVPCAGPPTCADGGACTTHSFAVAERHGSNRRRQACGGGKDDGPAADRPGDDQRPVPDRCIRDGVPRRPRHGADHPHRPAGRHALRPGEEPGEDAAGRVARPHPDAQVVVHRDRPLVRLHRLLRAVPDARRGLRRGVEPRVPSADHRRVGPLEPVRRDHRHRHDPRDHLPDLPAPEGPPAPAGPHEPLRRQQRGPRLLRRGRRPHRRHLHPADPRAQGLLRPDRGPRLVTPGLQRARHHPPGQPRPADRRSRSSRSWCA